MIQVIEFQEAYPHYNLGFMAHNELTATEKLLGRKSCLTHAKHNRTYQTWFFPKKMMQDLFDVIAASENNRMNFHLNLKDGKKVHFVMTRRVDALYGVCLETRERVSFEEGFKIKVTK